MPKQIRVNIRTAVNTDAVKRTKRNGRDVIIVPSATLPDDVVMNGIKYPAAEIAKGFKTLERTPAPAGHPMVNGKFVSASDPEGINLGWIGAWNENVRQEKMPDGRNIVLLDKVIDVQRANESENGRRTLEAIDNGDPVHTSTGLFLNVESVKGEDYDQIGSNMHFDHDAILLDEEGAATPSDGVGMMVNADGKEITVINSRVEWAEADLAWAAEHLLDSAERLEKAKEREALLPRLVEALKGIMSSGSAETNETVQEENVMDADTEKAFEAMNQKVDGLADAIGNAVSEAIKPLVDATTAANEREEAKVKAEKEALVNKVVEAKIDGIDEAVASKMDDTALNALLKMHEATNVKKAAPLASGFGLNTQDKDDGLNPLGKVQ